MPFRQELIEPLRSPPGTPQVLFVPAANEAAHIEAEHRSTPRRKPQGLERNAKNGRPALIVPARSDVPDAVPIRIDVLPAHLLAVPHRTVRIGLKKERVPVIVETVDQDRHVVVG